MVDGGLPLSIQHLDKGLLVTQLINGNAGNNGEGFRFGSIDDFEIPPFEIAADFPSALKLLGIK